MSTEPANPATPDTPAAGMPLCDTASERINLGTCPNCAQPCHDSRPDGCGGYTWLCAACQRTWRFHLSAADLDGPHYAVVFARGGIARYCSVVTDATTAYRRAADAVREGNPASVRYRPGRGRPHDLGEALMQVTHDLGSDVTEAVLALSYQGVGIAYVDRNTLNAHLTQSRGTGLTDAEWEAAKPHLSGPQYDRDVCELPVQDEFLNHVLANAGIDTGRFGDEQQKEATGGVH